MSGVEQGNFNNEEFIEEVARNECVYHRNNKELKKTKTKKTNRLATGKKSGRNLLFRSIRTAYGRYLNRL